MPFIDCAIGTDTAAGAIRADQFCGHIVKLLALYPEESFVHCNLSYEC